MKNNHIKYKRQTLVMQQFYKQKVSKIWMPDVNKNIYNEQCYHNEKSAS